MIWTYFFRTTGNVIGLRFRAEPDIILPEDTQLGTVVVEMGTKQSRLRQCYAEYY